MEATAEPFEQKKEIQDDGSIITTDNQGNEIRIPKEWNFDNSFVYESEELRKIF